MPFDFSSKNAPKGKPKIDSSGSLPRGPGGSSASPLGGRSGGSSGFQNKPERKTFAPPTTVQSGHQNTPRTRPTRPYVGRSAPSPSRELPWNKILPILGIVLAVVFCFVFRDAITEFIAQIVAWVIVILILFLVVKWVFLGKRK